MHQFKICERCVQRHCRIHPKMEQTSLGPKWTCKKFRKHATGFKLEEVFYEKEQQSV